MRFAGISLEIPQKTINAVHGHAWAMLELSACINAHAVVVPEDQHA